MYNIPILLSITGKHPGVLTQIFISAQSKLFKLRHPKNIQRPQKNDDIMEFFITTNSMSCLFCDASEVIFSLSGSMTAGAVLISALCCLELFK